MDSFEINKIVGAGLGALLFAMSLNVLATIIFTPHHLAVPGYDLPAAVEGAGGGGAAEAAQAPSEPLPVLLAKADPARGEKAVAKCKACHVFDKSGANKIGPGLFGVVTRPVASHEGFNYSAALKGKGGNWGFDQLNAFLTNPKTYAQGTIMNFAGVPKAEERADILAYLRSLSDNPAPLPPT